MTDTCEYCDNSPDSCQCFEEDPVIDTSWVQDAHIPEDEEVEEIQFDFNQKYNVDEYRKITLWGEITQHTSQEMTEALVQFAYKDSTAPVELWINSSGGDVTEAFVIYDIMKYVPYPIYTIGLGVVQSAATMILAAGTPECRSIFPHTSFMIHQFSYEYKGTLTDFTAMNDEVSKMQQEFGKLLVQNSNLSPKELNQILGSNVDRYMPVEDVIKYGFADYIR